MLPLRAFARLKLADRRGNVRPLVRHQVRAEVPGNRHEVLGIVFKIMQPLSRT